MLVSDLIKDLPTDFNEFHDYMNSLGILIYSNNQKIGSNYSDSLHHLEYLLFDIVTIDDLLSKYKIYLSKDLFGKNEILNENKSTLKKNFNSTRRLDITLRQYIYELNYVTYDDVSNPISKKILTGKINELSTKSNKYNSLYLIKKINTLSNKIDEIIKQRYSITEKEYGHLKTNSNVIRTLNSYADSDILTFEYFKNRKLIGNVESIQELIRLKKDLQKIEAEKQETETDNKEIERKIGKLNDKLSLIKRNQGFVFEDFKVNICILTENEHLRFPPKKNIKLQIDYQSFLIYLEELGFKTSFYYVDCFKGINETDIISKLVYNWEFSINSKDKIRAEILVYLNPYEELDEFQKLINFCNSHIEFVNKLKIIRPAMYLKNNPIEQIFNNYSKKLINKIENNKYNIENRNESDTKSKINNLIVELQKSARFEIPNVVHTTRRTSSNSWIDDESMIMNSFYNGTNENFGL